MRKSAVTRRGRVGVGNGTFSESISRCHRRIASSGAVPSNNPEVTAGQLRKFPGVSLDSCFLMLEGLIFSGKVDTLETDWSLRGTPLLLGNGNEPICASRCDGNAIQVVLVDPASRTFSRCLAHVGPRPSRRKAKSLPPIRQPGITILRMPTLEMLQAAHSPSMAAAE